MLGRCNAKQIIRGEKIGLLTDSELRKLEKNLISFAEVEKGWASVASSTRIEQNHSFLIVF